MRIIAVRDEKKVNIVGKTDTKYDKPHTESEKNKIVTISPPRTYSRIYLITENLMNA